ncbi:hypothetical protein [Streptosporangium lutulentum]|uniref:Protein phosphatase 2C n=1 Tax=Streptosporangium lutulentum TaxID=1461250 RepID=A0ABT9Q602_9ACTN|nr:hypothetical protein [Streptosporangium lutulentum]MDP9842092.1 hypothetical protein [Streptosporangium lutulentum]
MSEWVIAERAHVPKGAGRGEDLLVTVEDDLGLRCVGVIDGATDKSGRTYGGLSGGALAAERVAASLRSLPADTGPAAAVAAVTAGLARLRREWGVSEDDPLAPSAVAAVLLPRRRLVWRVGDVHLAIGRAGGWEHHRGDKAIDRVLAGARAAYLHCLLAEGRSVAELAREDPGRELVLPVLRRQSVLANREEAGPLGFGVLDGRRVPDRFVEVFPLDHEVLEVALASDGYLSAAERLRHAEDELAASLRADPMRIGAHPSTKGLTPGTVSFDDRTYVRVRRSADDTVAAG